MLNIQIGNGSRAAGFCCVSVGDGALTRGAYKVEIRSAISFPADATVESFDTLVNALQDVNLTYQALVEQKFAPAEFGVRSKAAIDIAIDACGRRRAELVAAAAEASRVAAAEAASAPVATATAVPAAASTPTN
jgi:hypothetical protein